MVPLDTYISHSISHFITRRILFQFTFLNFCNRMFYSTAPPACSLLTILQMAQMYKLYILYFVISCILYYPRPTCHCICHFRSGLSATAIKNIVLYFWQVPIGCQ